MISCFVSMIECDGRTVIADAFGIADPANDVILNVFEAQRMDPRFAITCHVNGFPIGGRVDKGDNIALHIVRGLNRLFGGVGHAGAYLQIGPHTFWKSTYDQGVL